MSIRTIVLAATALMCLAHDKQAVADTESPTQYVKGFKLNWDSSVPFNIIEDVASDPSGNIYVATGRESILRVNADGAVGQPITLPVNSPVKWIFPGPDGQIVTEGIDWLAVSIDYGAHWDVRPSSRRSKVHQVGFSSVKPAVVLIEVVPTEWATPDDKINRSIFLVTEGKRWEETSPQVTFDDMHLSTQEIGWARSGKDIYTSSDGGRHWKKSSAVLSVASKQNVVAAAPLGIDMVIATSAGDFLLFGPIGQHISQLPRLPEGILWRYRVLTDGRVAAATKDRKIYLLDALHKQWQLAGKWTTSAKNIFFMSDLTTVIYAADGRLISKRIADEDSASKTIVASTNKPYCANVSSAGNAFLVGGGVITSTNPSKLQWQIVATDVGSEPVCSMAGSGFGVVATKDLISFTNDGGLTWAKAKDKVGGLPTVVRASDESYALIQIVHRDEVVSSSLHRIESDGALVDLPPTPAYFSDIRQADKDLWKALSSWGAAYESRDRGRAWHKIGSNLWPDKSDEDIVSSWKDRDLGWLVNDTDKIYLTHDGGATWSSTQSGLEAGAELTLIHFFDRSNGIAFDDKGEIFYRSNDGGRRWAKVDSGRTFFSNSLLAYESDGRGIFADNDSVKFITAQSGVPLRLAVSMGISDVRLKIDSTDPIWNPNSVTKFDTFISINGSPEIILSPADMNITRGERSIEASWTPGGSSPLVPLGASIAHTINLSESNGIQTTLASKALVFDPWIQRHRQVIIFICVLVSAAAVIVIIYLTAPYILIPIKRYRETLVKIFDSVPGLGPTIDFILLGLLLDRLGRSTRVQMAWAKACRGGRITFRDLPESWIQLFQKNPKILDVWVERALSSVRDRLWDQARLLGVNEFVPLHVIIKTFERPGYPESLLLDSPNRIHLSSSDEPCTVRIVGAGGTGKTTLAIRLSLWVMECDDRQSILGWPSLAVIIRSSSGEAFFRIKEELLTATPADLRGDITDGLVEALLSTKRLVPVFDGLSEMPDGVLEGALALSSKYRGLSVVTARRRLPLLSSRFIEILVCRLREQDINQFLAQLINSTGLRHSISPLQETSLAKKLIELVSARSDGEIPAVFVKLFLDIFVESIGQGVRAPMSTGEVVQRYVRLDAEPGTARAEDRARMAEIVARLSLEERLFPVPVSSELVDAKAIELGWSDYEVCLRDLEKSGILELRLSPVGSTYNFVLDPVAEYLYAAFIVRKLDRDLAAWDSEVRSMRTKFQSPEDIYGYLEALHDLLDTAAQTAHANTDPIRQLLFTLRSVQSYV